MLDNALDQTRQLPLKVGNPFEVRADELNCIGSVFNFALDSLDLAGRPPPRRTQLPRTHSADHLILSVLQGSENWIFVVEVTPQIVHFFRKGGLFVQHV